MDKCAFHCAGSASQIPPFIRGIRCLMWEYSHPRTIPMARVVLSRKYLPLYRMYPDCIVPYLDVVIGVSIVGPLVTTGRQYLVIFSHITTKHTVTRGQQQAFIWRNEHID